MSLARKECVPCKGGVPPLKGEELEQLNEQIRLVPTLERGNEIDIINKSRKCKIIYTKISNA